MWDPPKTEDDTPWAAPEASEPTQRPEIDPVSTPAGDTAPSVPPMPAPRVGDEPFAPAGSSAPRDTPPLFGSPPAPTSPPPAPISRPPAPPAPPSPFSLSGAQQTEAIVAPPAVTAPTEPPSAFRAIGAPAAPPAGTPASSPTVISSMPSVTPRPASMPLASAPSVAPATTVAEPAKRRRWPWLLLALSTVAASGLIAWLVATTAQTEPAPVAVPAAEVIPPPTETAGPLAEVVDVELLANEPFAAAAELIRPSVVQLQLAQGLGTGVIINSNGTILTAAHVVGDADTVTVTFFDGSSVEGEVVGTHEPTDVAVVSVNPEGRNLVPAPLAAGEDVRVGQLAVAVGSPFGFDQTVTAGIISAVDRIVNGVSMVQTDAPINPGNSGGPLINLDGEVVGINDLIFTESGTSAGVGFAISIDLAVIIADQLVAGVEPQLALLGVSTGPPPNGAAGAIVEAVSPDSAAEAAGLQVGDIVVGVNGTNTRGSADLRAQIIDQAPGSDVSLSVIRDGEQQELLAMLGRTG